MPPTVIHLFRGAPAVRSWSKYRETIREWTLCGIRRAGGSEETPTTEYAHDVTCRYCLKLMGATAKRGTSRQERASGAGS